MRHPLTTLPTKVREKGLTFCDTPEASCWFLSDSPFPENDTKKPVRHKVDYIFSQLPSFRLNLLNFCPSPLPHPALTPPQTHFLARVLASPLTPHFSPAPWAPPPAAAAQRSCPGGLILAEFLTSLSSPEQSWHRRAGSPWKKTGRRHWGSGLGVHLTWVLSCLNHFKYDFLS